MSIFPHHHLSRSCLLGTPRWRVADPGVSTMTLANGVLRSRDQLGQAVYAVDLSYRCLTDADAAILHSHYQAYKRGVSTFGWFDPLQGPLSESAFETFTCRYDPSTPPRITPQAAGYHLWDAEITLLPILPTESVAMLVAWWPMDEGGVLLVAEEEALEVGTEEVLSFGGGADVSDATGNGHDGTASQTMDIMAATGKLGTALLFNGTTDYVGVDDASDLRLTEGGSILAWINATGLGESNEGRIVDKSTTTSAGAGYSFGLSASSKLAFRISGDAEDTLSSASAITLSTWHHVAVVFDAYGRRLYVNGVDVTATGSGFTRLPPASTAALRIGNRSGATDRSFNGMIDDLRIYQRPLSLREVQAIYASGSGTAEEVVP